MISSQIKNIALIVAAGRGRRLEGNTPKQYRVIAGYAVLKWSVLSFLRHTKIDMVQVVYNPEDINLYDAALNDLELPSPIVGGDNRQSSVRLGLESISQFEPTNVLIHDGARPIVSKSLIDIMRSPTSTPRSFAREESVNPPTIHRIFGSTNGSLS